MLPNSTHLPCKVWSLDHVEAKFPYLLVLLSGWVETRRISSHTLLQLVDIERSMQICDETNIYITTNIAAIFYSFISQQEFCLMLPEKIQCYS